MIRNGNKMNQFKCSYLGDNMLKTTFNFIDKLNV